MNIQRALDRTNALHSKLTPKAIKQLDGLSSPKVWHLLNNLVSQVDTYLEVGCFKGSTLCAAMYGNDNVKGYAVDNFVMNKESRDILYKNIEPYKNITFFEQDAWTVDLTQIKEKIRVYFYDGDHSFEAHYKALTYFYPVLADEFIYVCDDWDMKRIPNATFEAAKFLNLDKADLHNLKGNNKEFWNGIGVIKFRKQ